MTTIITLAIKAYLGGTWVDLTSDYLVAGTAASANWGMTSNKPTDFLAKTGQMTFALKNATGKYTPGGAHVISADWKKGTKVKAEFTYNGQTWVRFYGAISSMRIDWGTSGERKVYVTAFDWMDYASQYPLNNPAVALDQRIDEAVTTILEGMPIQPLATDFDTGANVFPTIFNNATLKTRAYSEFSKLAMSEMAPIYVKKDKTNGETLRVESGNTRVYNTAIKQVKITSTSVNLLDEAGSALLDEAGANLLDEGYTLQDVEVNNTMSSMDVLYGDNLINRVTTSANPTRIDDKESNIYTLDSPLYLSVGETKPFYVQFTEAQSKRMVSALPPEDSYQTTLLHFDAGSGEELIVDEAGKPFDDFNMDLATNLKQFGAASGYFAGNAYIRGNYSTAYEFGTDDFTVEWWEYRYNTTSGTSSINRTGDAGFIPWTFGYSDGTNACVNITSNGSSWDIANAKSFGAISTSTWTNYAIVRSGVNFYMFKNGTLVNSFTSSASILASTGDFVVGKYGTAYITALIDELRITKGLARYTESYTVATEPFTLSGLIYAAWTKSNGTGTELTDDFTVTVDYGAAGALVTVVNNGTSPGYLTTLKINGKIIETVSPVTDVQEDAASIAEYGYHELSINQPYQQDFVSGREKAATILDAEKQPRTSVEKISMYANKDEAHTMYFLDTDVGDLVSIIEDQTETNAAFFIQGMEWNAIPGATGVIVNYSWNVRKFREQVTPINVRFGDPIASGSNYLNFGYLPAISGDNVQYRIFSYWYNSNSSVLLQTGTIIGAWNGSSGEDYRGYYIRYNASGNKFRVLSLSGTTATNWQTNYTNVANTWNHFVVAFDVTSTSAPTVYQNGSLLTTPTAVSSWAVTGNSEEGTEVTIGTNLLEATIADMRIYNGNQVGSLSALVSSLYSGGRYGTGNTDGLLFRGFNAPITDVTDYEVGAHLTEDMKVIDDIGYAVGTPKNSPLGQAA